MRCFLHCFRTDTDEGFRFSFSFRKNRSGINFLQSNQRQKWLKRLCGKHRLFKRTMEIQKHSSPLPGGRGF